MIIILIILIFIRHFVKISFLGKLKTILNFQFDPIYSDKDSTKVIILTSSLWHFVKLMKKSNRLVWFSIDYMF